MDRKKLFLGISVSFMIAGGIPFAFGEEPHSEDSTNLSTPAEPAISTPSQQQISTGQLSTMSITDLLSVEVTSVSRAAESARRVPMSVYTVSRDELLDWAPTEPNDVLKRLPGASFYDTNYTGQNSVMTRGQSGIYRTVFAIEQMPIYDQGQRFRQNGASAAQVDQNLGSPVPVYLYDNRQPGVPAVSSTLGGEVDFFHLARVGADVRLEELIPQQFTTNWLGGSPMMV
jgi:hypothetical protein